MKFSDETISILKNFASINSNLVFREGNTIKTIAEAKNILASADITEDIPQDFGIYDLNEFLSVYFLLDDPELSFERGKINFISGNSRVSYFTADESILTSPTTDIQMPDADVTFDLSETQIAQLNRAASTLGVQDLVISSDDGSLIATLTSLENPTSNSYSLDLNQEYNGNISAIFNINNFKFIKEDYLVRISSKLISRFECKNVNKDVIYYVALEKSSSFGG